MSLIRRLGQLLKVLQHWAISSSSSSAAVSKASLNLSGRSTPTQDHSESSSRGQNTLNPIMCIFNEYTAIGCRYVEQIQLVQSCAAGFHRGYRECYANDYVIHDSRFIFAMLLCTNCYYDCIHAIRRACIHTFVKSCVIGTGESLSEELFEQEALASTECEMRELQDFEALCEERTQENADAYNGGSRIDGDLGDLEPVGVMYDSSDEEDASDGDVISIEDDDDDDDEGESEALEDGADPFYVPNSYDHSEYLFPSETSDEIFRGGDISEEETVETDSAGVPQRPNGLAGHEYLLLGTEVDDGLGSRIRGLAAAEP